MLQCNITVFSDLRVCTGARLEDAPYGISAVLRKITQQFGNGTVKPGFSVASRLVISLTILIPDSLTPKSNGGSETNPAGMAATRV
jgi:hypothetical protein